MIARSASNWHLVFRLGLGQVPRDDVGHMAGSSCSSDVRIVGVVVVSGMTAGSVALSTTVSLFARAGDHLAGRWS